MRSESHAFRVTCVQGHMRSGFHAFRIPCVQGHIRSGSHAFRIPWASGLHAFRIPWASGLHAFRIPCFQDSMLSGFHGLRGFACGSLVQDMIVSLGMPEPSIAAPNGSSSSLAPIQLSRSAIASKGLALACTPASKQEGAPLTTLHDSAKRNERQCSRADPIRMDTRNPQKWDQHILLRSRFFQVEKGEMSEPSLRSWHSVPSIYGET